MPGGTRPRPAPVPPPYQFGARAAFFALLAVMATDARAITINTVPVGNVNNPADTTVMTTDGTSGYGSVAYNYRIGTTEVTVGQHSAFLNAVAATDTYGLYDTNMATDLNIAGIARSGSPGTYTYSTIGSASKPIAYCELGRCRPVLQLAKQRPTNRRASSRYHRGRSYALNGAVTCPSRQRWFCCSSAWRRC